MDAEELARQFRRVPGRYRSIVRKVNALEPGMREQTDRALRSMAQRWRERHGRGQTLRELLPEVFAAVRECARRRAAMRHFDVQIAGGCVLHRGLIAEMQTGEGKTLVATLPAVLNAIPGEGVHVVTVNDYLARRDREWMAPVYEGLGLTVGCLYGGLAAAERRVAYARDVTYGANKEFGFDFLRDQVRRRTLQRDVGDVIRRWDMAQQGGGAACVQRGHAYAIVDEVDSVLIDEARVPLILSGSAGRPSPMAAAFRWADEVAAGLRLEEHFTVDRSDQTVELSAAGRQRVREAVVELEGPAPDDRPLHLLVEQAIRARRLFERGREYIVQDGEIVIVDEFTGRMLPDRNWQVGLHQAIQAKESLPVTEETRPLATVTYQRYFKRYDKLAGMTGTAFPARREFRRVYDLRVVRIPPNRPLHRRRLPDRVFRSRVGKLRAVEERVAELHAEGRPVLVGTRSVKRSEQLSRALTRRGIRHSVLNAKKHAEEAALVARAGLRGQVTICTNMAGRGTDIKLGAGVAELGGLHVIGTERHDARRIDLQLGGRAGRQGDPGTYEFMVSLDDDLLRLRYPRLSVWLQRHAGGALRRRLLQPLFRALFRLAQRKVEREHLMARLALLERDEWLDEVHDMFGYAPDG